MYNFLCYRKIIARRAYRCYVKMQEKMALFSGRAMARIKTQEIRSKKLQFCRSRDTMSIVVFESDLATSIFILLSVQ